MIHEIDEALRGLLAPAVTGDVAFEAPTRDWAARRNAPTLNAYLYDIREDVARRERGAYAERDAQGIVTRRPPTAALVPALVPGDGTDLTSGGRAPAALGRDGAAAAPRDALRRRRSGVGASDHHVPSALRRGTGRPSRGRSRTSGRRSAVSSSPPWMS